MRLLTTIERNNRMKKTILMIFSSAILAVASPLFAATEVVGGYTWTYQKIGETAKIFYSNSYAAISPNPTGDLMIPSSLGGCSVVTIGNYAFRECSKITSVIIPDSVTAIMSAAFFGCSGLTRVTIPDSVTSFGFNAFACCDALEAFVVGKNNPAYCSVNGLMLSKDCKSLVEVPEGLASVTIPDSVTCIGVKAFGFGEKITSVTIPDKVTRIENGAFSGCDNLKTVTFKGDAPTEMGDGVFPSRCTVYVNRSASGFTTDANGKWHDAKVEYYGPELVIDKNGKLTSVNLHGSTEVTLPNRVIIIGQSAFSGCSELTSVTIPSSVTKIEQSAFSGCSGLTSVTIPSNVTSIGNNAFSGCSGLHSVNISDLCAWCEIEFVNSGSTYTYANPLTYAHNLYLNGELIRNLIIPDSVKCIKNGTFSCCSGLISVSIPTCVTNIGNSAFYNCSNITNVIIPNSVKDVGQSAFCGCSELTSLVIGDGVTNIGSSAFSGCNKLKNLVMEGGLTSIGNSAFYNCSGLTNVVMPNGVVTIGSSAFYNCNTLTAVQIPDSVVTIGNYAFQKCSSLTSVKVGDSVTSIDSGVFRNCSSLTNVMIGCCVTSIGSEAFRDCSSLVSVTIPNSVTSIGNSAFYNCSELVSVTIPSSVTSVGNSAFSCCNNVKNVVVPGQQFGIPFEKVTNLVISAGTMSVLDSSFDGCSSLENVTIPNSVTSIGNYSFRGCGCIDDIAIPDSVTSIGNYAFYSCTGLTSVVIGDHVTSIGTYAFYNCSGLASLMIPDSVANIGDTAFYGCNGLVSILVNSANTCYASVNGLLLTKDCKTLVQGVNGNVTIPYSVTTIASSAFCGRSGLVNISMPDGITSIGASAFCGCSGMTSVTIPDSVTDIGTGTFEGCSGLRSVTLGDGVTSIVAHAFRNCSGLTSVMIPNGVKSIGDYAFYGCGGLTSVTIPNSVTSVGKYAFCNCGALVSVTMPDSITSIGTYAFSGCIELMSIKISNGLTSISDCMFAECKRLASVVIPSRVKTIGETAFYNCSDLTCISIPSSVTRIKDRAFYGCNNVREATVPGWKCDLPFDKVTKLVISPGTTSIANREFSELNSLTCVTLPGSMSNIIGTQAFLGCKNLVTAIVPESLKNVTNYYAYVFNECSPNFGVFCCDFDVRFDERLPWSGNDGKLRSRAIGNNAETFAEIIVPSAGKLAFKWKASSESDGDEIYDYAYLSVDGVPQGTLTKGYQMEGIAIGGKTDWISVMLDVQGKGPHTIRWTYCKDDVDEANVGEDCVWLNEIAWTPKVLVSYDIAGADGQVPESVSELSGTTLTLPQATGFSRLKYTFGGWSDGSHVYAAGAQYEITDQDVVFTAVWSANTLAAPVISSADVANGGTIESASATITITATQGTEIHYTTDGRSPTAQSPRYTAPFVADGMSVTIKAIAVRDNYFDSAVTAFTFTRKPYTLAECIGLNGVDVMTEGVAGWARILGGEAHDGVAALKSGAIGDCQTNCVRIVVSGPGVLSFWWKASCEGTNRGKRRDGCAFMIDDVEVKYTDGTTNDWSQVMIEVYGVGDHTLKWVYGKNGNGTFDGADCAWLDSVVWTPTVVDPIPAITSNNEVPAALAGTTDASLTANITNVAQYAAYRSWALSVTNAMTTAQTIKESTRTWLSYAFAADALIDKELTSDEVKIESFTPASTDGKFEFTVSVKDVNIGGGSVAVETLKENLKKVLGIEGAATLTTGAFSSDNIDITFDTPVDGKARFTVSPPVDAGSSFFMRVKVK